MTFIVDASAVVAALTDRGTDGSWARRVLADDRAASGHHVRAEVARVLRRMELAGDVTEGIASIAHAELLALDVELFPYEFLAGRIWQLRNTVTISDAWYVALAEVLDAPLATLDLRLARAPGPRCKFLTP